MNRTSSRRINQLTQQQQSKQQGQGLIRSGLSVQELKAMTALRVGVSDQPPIPKISDNIVRCYETANPQQLVAAGLIQNNGQSTTQHNTSPNITARNPPVNNQIQTIELPTSALSQSRLQSDVLARQRQHQARNSNYPVTNGDDNLSTTSSNKATSQKLNNLRLLEMQTNGNSTFNMQMNNNDSLSFVGSQGGADHLSNLLNECSSSKPVEDSWNNNSNNNSNISRNAMNSNNANIDILSYQLDNTNLNEDNNRGNNWQSMQSVPSNYNRSRNAMLSDNNINNITNSNANIANKTPVLRSSVQGRVLAPMNNYQQSSQQLGVVNEIEYRNNNNIDNNNNNNISLNRSQLSSMNLSGNAMNGNARTLNNNSNLTPNAYQSSSTSQNANNLSNLQSNTAFANNRSPNNSIRKQAMQNALIYSNNSNMSANNSILGSGMVDLSNSGNNINNNHNLNNVNILGNVNGSPTQLAPIQRQLSAVRQQPQTLGNSYINGTSISSQSNNFMSLKNLSPPRNRTLSSETNNLVFEIAESVLDANSPNSSINISNANNNTSKLRKGYQFNSSPNDFQDLIAPKTMVRMNSVDSALQQQPQFSLQGSASHSSFAPIQQSSRRSLTISGLGDSLDNYNHNNNNIHNNSNNSNHSHSNTSDSIRDYVVKSDGWLSGRAETNDIMENDNNYNNYNNNMNNCLLDDSFFLDPGMLVGNNIGGNNANLNSFGSYNGYSGNNNNNNNNNNVNGNLINGSISMNGMNNSDFIEIEDVNSPATHMHRINTNRIDGYTSNLVPSFYNSNNNSNINSSNNLVPSFGSMTRSNSRYGDQ